MRTLRTCGTLSTALMTIVQNMCTFTKKQYYSSKRTIKTILVHNFRLILTMKLARNEYAYLYLSGFFVSKLELLVLMSTCNLYMTFSLSLYCDMAKAWGINALCDSRVHGPNCKMR